jgi:hypothetical protein
MLVCFFLQNDYFLQAFTFLMADRAAPIPTGAFFKKCLYKLQIHFVIFWLFI